MTTDLAGQPLSKTPLQGGVDERNRPCAIGRMFYSRNKVHTSIVEVCGELSAWCLFINVNALDELLVWKMEST